jgi:endonuclease/exonuclease/phosphatase family metal-dependent hydrolase
MTWNIHHGAGLDGLLDLDRIAALIQKENVDLVGLQEVDKGVARTGRIDSPARLAALTGMFCVFSNNYHYQGGEYGNAILSRLPVLSSTNRHFRMLHEGEQRGFLSITFSWEGQPCDFITTHLDYRPDDAERLSNIEELRQAIAGSASPMTILCGDFNDLPGSRTHRAVSDFMQDAWTLQGRGSGATIPAARPNRRIDYIFFAGPQLKVTHIRVLETTFSDHRPVLAEFEWPGAGATEGVSKTRGESGDSGVP